jgi:L-rhamnose-H+ transport protein
MTPNPLIGVLYHWLGGLASASFYVPYKGVKRWSWEIYWLTGGIFSWLFAPWFFASLQTYDLLGVLGRAPDSAKYWPVFFGLLWGFGGLGYGLVMRYLGLSLGMAVVLGLCTVFGTLIPPLFTGEFHEKLLATTSGNIVLLGLGLTLLGIVIVAIAGAKKDAMLTPEQKKAVVAEFDFKKGIIVAIFAGIMSACFAFGLAAGEPIKALSAAAGTGPLWTGLPVLCLVMFGGLITNGIWSRMVARVRHCCPISCSARWRARPGISSSSSTRWARARWAGWAFPAGRCTWPASSSSAPAGASPSASGRMPGPR